MSTEFSLTDYVTHLVLAPPPPPALCGGVGGGRQGAQRRRQRRQGYGPLEAGAGGSDSVGFCCVLGPVHHSNDELEMEQDSTAFIATT